MPTMDGLAEVLSKRGHDAAAQRPHRHRGWRPVLAQLQYSDSGCIRRHCGRAGMSAPRCATTAARRCTTCRYGTCSTVRQQFGTYTAQTVPAANQYTISARLGLRVPRRRELSDCRRSEMWPIQVTAEPKPCSQAARSFLPVPSSPCSTSCRIGLGGHDGHALHQRFGAGWT